jgi:hypothetical protein
MVSLIEQRTGVRTYKIVDLVPLKGDPGGLAAKLARYPRGAVIPAADTWLAQVNAGDVLSAKSGQPSPFCGIHVGEVLDAGLYLGQPAKLTESRPNPAIYLDTTYWAELQRRDTILAQGGTVPTLDSYRQEQPPGYPPIAGAAC